MRGGYHRSLPRTPWQQSLNGRPLIRCHRAVRPSMTDATRTIHCHDCRSTGHNTGRPLPTHPGHQFVEQLCAAEVHEVAGGIQVHEVPVVRTHARLSRDRERKLRPRAVEWGCSNRAGRPVEGRHVKGDRAHGDCGLWWSLERCRQASAKKLSRGVHAASKGNLATFSRIILASLSCLGSGRWRGGGGGVGGGGLRRRSS